MLDAETKRRIGVLGATGLSSFAQQSYVLSPPTRLGGWALCSMGSRPRLSADAAFAAYWNPGLAPHRISLRLRAQLLRLPLKGRSEWPLGARASRQHPFPYGGR